MIERTHDGDRQDGDICPHCGEQGFDGQGHVSVQGTRMYLMKCWNCGTRFATEIPSERGDSDE